MAFGTDQNTDIDYSNYFDPKVSREFFTAVAVFMTAYSFQFNLFPVIKSLKVKTQKQSYLTIILALSMAMGIYITFSMLAIYIFGSSLEPDVMQNVGGIVNHEVISAILRVAFAVVIVCHIPYIFFSCKEAFLIILDEYDQQTVSKELDRKLHQYKTTYIE